MTRCHTLHAPTAGIFLAWPAGVTVVLDPGPDEHTRRSHLAREHTLVTSVVVLVAVAVVLLLRSGQADRPWTLAAGLLLAAWACHVARPARRTVPAALVETLEPLRTTTPARPGQVHLLVWDTSGLIALEARPGTPSSHDRARDIAQHLTHLRHLVAPAVLAGDAQVPPAEGAAHGRACTVPDHAHHATHTTPRSLPEEHDREPHR